MRHPDTRQIAKHLAKWAEEGVIEMTANLIEERDDARKQAPHGMICWDCKWWDKKRERKVFGVEGECKRRAPTGSGSLEELYIIRVAIVDLLYIQAGETTPLNEDCLEAPDEYPEAAHVFPRTLMTDWCGEVERRDGGEP